MEMATATAWASGRGPAYAHASGEPLGAHVAAAAPSTCRRRTTPAARRAHRGTTCPTMSSQGRTSRRGRGHPGEGGDDTRSSGGAHGRSAGRTGSTRGRPTDASYWEGGRRSRAAASSSLNNGGRRPPQCSAGRASRRPWARWRRRAARGPGVVAMATRAPLSSPSRGGIPARNQPRGRACLCGRSSRGPWPRAAGRRGLG